MTTEPTELDIETEIVRMKREKLARDLAASYGMTLEEAQERIRRFVEAYNAPLRALVKALNAARTQHDELAATLVSDDPALD